MAKEAEKKLLIKAKEGDKDAFNELMRDNREKVFSLALRMLEDYDAALDITQDTFLKAYEKLDSFNMEAAFFTWLYRITMNLAINYKNKQKRLRPLEWVGLHKGSQAENLVENNLIAKLERDEKLKRVKKAVKTLPTKTKAVFNLRYYEGLEFDEVAEIMGSKPTTIRVQYSQAIKKLKDYFKVK